MPLTFCRRRCAPWSLLACAPFDGQMTDTGQDRPRHRFGNLHKTGTGTGHMAGASSGCALPALYECRLRSLMVARGGLRRSAAARERTLPGSLERGPFPAFPGCGPGWSNVGLCGDIRGCVCPSAHGAAGSKQSAASPAELAGAGGGVRSRSCTGRLSWLSRFMLCMYSLAQDRRMQDAMRSIHSSSRVEL